LFFRNGHFSVFRDSGIVVDNNNSAGTAGALDQFRPDIVRVNRTRLIRPPLLDRISGMPLGMINLHTNFEIIDAKAFELGNMD
jgi:hypothetical protein